MLKPSCVPLQCTASSNIVALIVNELHTVYIAFLYSCLTSTNARGYHARPISGWREQFGVECLAQGHFRTQSRLDRLTGYPLIPGRLLHSHGPPCCLQGSVPFIEVDNCVRTFSSMEVDSGGGVLLYKRMNITSGCLCHLDRCLRSGTPRT